MKSKGLIVASATLAASDERNVSVLWDAAFGEAVAPIPKELAEALKHNVAINSYPPVQGSLKLRENWASFLSLTHKALFKASDMVITPGSKFAIQSVFAALAPSCVIIPTPAWVGYYPCAKMGGHNIQFLTCDANFNYKIRISDLNLICKSHANEQIVLVINSPNNPTGIVYSREEMEAICAYCKGTGVILLFDGIYASECSFSQERIYTPLTFAPELTIYVGGMSKLFGMGGRRIGFCHIPDTSLRKEVVSYISCTVSGVDISTQQSVASYLGNQATANDFIQRWQHWSCVVSRYIEGRLLNMRLETSSPEGGFYVYADFKSFRVKLEKEYQVRDSLSLASLLLKEIGIRVLPASVFADNSLAVRIVTQGYSSSIDEDDAETTDGLLMKHGQEILRGIDQLELFLLNLA